MFTGEIEGFLIDLPKAEDLKNRFPEKVSFFEENFYNNLYGFAFKKNNTKLVNEFHSFLREIYLTKIYPEWNIRDTSNLTVIKTINHSNPKIREVILPDIKPLCFEQNNDIIGYEIYLIYEFARSNNYDIEFTALENSADRINFIIDNKADITGVDYLLLIIVNNLLIFHIQYLLLRHL